MLAICPVVRAPSGQGERAAPRLAQHMNTGTYVAHMHTHMRAYMGVIAAGYNRYRGNEGTRVCVNKIMAGPHRIGKW